MRGFFIDVQGTLIDDKNFLPLDGAVEFTKYLSKKIFLLYCLQIIRKKNQANLKII